MTSAFRHWHSQMDMAWGLRDITWVPSWICIIFPQSLINILSVTYFARQFYSLMGTGINTQKLKSCFNWTQISSCLQSNILHPISQRFSSMNFLSCQRYFMRSYRELWMSQIIQYMAVVLLICILMMTTKINILTNLEINWSAFMPILLSQHLRMISYQSFSKLSKIYFSQMMDGPGSLRWIFSP